MSPLAGQNRNFEKSSFCNFFILKVAHYMRKRRTFVRRFPCCIFHQHILVRDGRLELPTSCSQSKRATNCANPGFLVIQFCTRCGQTCGQAVFLTISACGGSACIAGVSRDCGHSIFQLEGGATRSQTRRDTNFAIPGYSIFAMIPRRGRKTKIFLSVVIYVVKTTFAPFSAIGGNPANAGVTRLCDVSTYPVPDTATALPNQARYQLRYTRMCNGTTA